MKYRNFFKNNLNLILFISVIITMTIPILIIKTTNATTFEIDKNINNCMNVIEDLIKEKPEIALSSNPYDYINLIKDTDEYNKLIQLDISALDDILLKINDSEINGLKEYILADIAINISKVDTNKEDMQFSNAKDFVQKLNTKKQLLSTQFEEIMNSNKTSEEKLDLLKEYGCYSIPYILNYLENNDDSKNSYLFNYVDSFSNTDYDKLSKEKWININKSKFDELVDN